MPVLVVGLLIVLVALIGGAAYGINKLIPTRKQMNLSDYYGQNEEGEAALILGTEKTVNQISMELGFQYPQHFNRIFKKATGLTPSEYRKTTV